MPEDFKQTVNLRERMLKAQNSVKENFERKPSAVIAKSARSVKSLNAEGIDQVYNDSDDEKSDLQKIVRPRMQPNREILYRQIIIILLILMFGSGAFWYFSSHKENKSLTSIEKSDANWYSVKLINGEIYYGEIENTASDPVVLKNVYYNYDQINPTAPDAQKKEETASLRLVKRGNETHGPDGNMEIVRTQVVLMEQLKPESKVLKAILDYEK